MSNDYKKPSGLDCGAALIEYGTPMSSSETEKQMQIVLHEKVLIGALTREQAQEIGYRGSAQHDPVYAMLHELKLGIWDSIGEVGYLSPKKLEQLARALVAAGWTPPIELSEEKAPEDPTVLKIHWNRNKRKAP